MKLKPLADNVVLKSAQLEDTTASGIILATANKEKSAVYAVVSAGPAAKEVKAGDQVVVGQYAGTDMKLDNEEYKFVKEEDILAIVGG